LKTPATPGLWDALGRLGQEIASLAMADSARNRAGGNRFAR
jgi:hypothetical protein